MPDIAPEPILDPDLPIIDPHHHLWDLRPLLGAFPPPRHRFIESLVAAQLYLPDDLAADTASGHRVIGTVFVECGAFYRHDGPTELRPAGEVDYVRRVTAAHRNGPVRACAGIVGHADLTLGDGVLPVIDALVTAGDGALRGIRQQGGWDADPGVFGGGIQLPEGQYRSDAFRTGLRHLASAGLSFDAWVLEPQLGEVIDLARACPEVAIVLDHCGSPLNIASYAGTLPDRFAGWRNAIRTLATCPNVSIKLGGLGMATCGMPDHGPAAGLSSTALAELWRPYIETCIEAFGPDRAMFESNFPVDRWAGSYATVWNAFKRIADGASVAEKRALFTGTAARFYRLDALLADA